MFAAKADFAVLVIVEAILAEDGRQIGAGGVKRRLRAFESARGDVIQIDFGRFSASPGHGRERDHYYHPNHIT